MVAEIRGNLGVIEYNASTEFLIIGLSQNSALLLVYNTFRTGLMRWDTC